MKHHFFLIKLLRVLRRNTGLREEKEKEKSNFLFSSLLSFLAVSFRGQNLLKGRLDWSPLGVTNSLTHA